MIQYDETLLEEVERIIEYLGNIFGWTEKFTDVQQLQKDSLYFNVSVKSFERVVEIINRWRNRRRQGLFGHLKNKYRQLGKRRYTKMRNRTVHHSDRLGDADYKKFWSIVRDDLPNLMDIMKEIRADCLTEIQIRKETGNN